MRITKRSLSIFAILALMFVTTVPTHAQNGVSAAPAGTFLSAGTLALVETVNNAERSIDIFGGNLPVDYEVGRWEFVDHNAWTGFSSVAHAQGDALTQARRRASDGTFAGYAIFANGQVIARDRDSDTMVHAASLTSGQWVTIASYTGDIEVHAAQATTGVALQPGQSLPPGVRAVWAELDINARVVRIFYGPDHGILTARIEPNYHLDVWGPYNDDAAMIQGACSTLAERYGQAISGVFGSQFQVLFRSQLYNGGPCPVPVPQQQTPPNLYLGQPPTFPQPSVPVSQPSYGPAPSVPSIPQPSYTPPAPVASIPAAPATGIPSVSANWCEGPGPQAVPAGVIVSKGTPAVLRIIDWGASPVTVSVMGGALPQDVFVANGQGDGTIDVAVWQLCSGRSWQSIARTDPCSEIVQALGYVRGQGFQAVGIINGTPLPVSYCPDP